MRSWSAEVISSSVGFPAIHPVACRLPSSIRLFCKHTTRIPVVSIYLRQSLKLSVIDSYFSSRLEFFLVSIVYQDP
ncbi:uncharacterized protein BO97DRAFT_67571 [Aspergillus homomorphus CBS 101889]|uniref:Uncharacterized protein n=1 Tax=Aspergillus homomorphus (strain CBS 101889) TaxID=1450537 RepID=A0A395HVM7_ASPHC|nr:hypothetical protein BO97DRAFT_67571 [Aspergillus homomorphus CBS 101889]RAL11982.1 hypothetical protein BO97DRAFT_67571 [Aspergillus homomorphus CBS 101889]